MGELFKMIREKDWDAVTQFFVNHAHDNLVLSNNSPLQNACRIGAPLQVISKLLEIGGRDLLLKRSTCRNGHNPLHYACMRRDKTSFAVVAKLLEVGGIDLLFQKSRFGQNSLHCACRHRAPTKVILKLIDVGGRGLVLAKDNHGENSLHMAFCNQASSEVILKLIEVGGRDLVMTDNNHGSSILHRSGNYRLFDSDMLDLLLQYGGEGMLLQKNSDDKTPLQKIITEETRYQNRTTLIKNASLLMSKCIELQIGGEYGIGGLFDFSTCNQKLQYEVYKHWDNLTLPALQQLMISPHNRHQPILQAVIVNNAPPRIIKDIVWNFPESINTTDSLGRFPIDFAVHRKISWYDGMKEIVETFISTQKLSVVLTVCARNGLPWENGMKSVVDKGALDDIEKQDDYMAFYPFMLAALGEKYSSDLGSVFHLIQKSPSLVKRYGV